jgi:uncharacterized membrane protein
VRRARGWRLAAGDWRLATGFWQLHEVRKLNRFQYISIYFQMVGLQLAGIRRLNEQWQLKYDFFFCPKLIVIFVLSNNKKGNAK